MESSEKPALRRPAGVNIEVSVHLHGAITVDQYERFYDAVELALHVLCGCDPEVNEPQESCNLIAMLCTSRRTDGNGEVIDP